MTVISANNLCKSFKIKTKEPGFKGSIKPYDFTYRYKEIEAVRNVCFNVDKGEILAFIGPNGAGKSTHNKNAYRNTLSNGR